MEMSKYRIVIPGAVTSLSIFAGIFAIYFCFGSTYAESIPSISCWLVIFAVVIDGLDGKIARLTKSSSEFGIQFDSMADIITFGAAVSAILYRSAYMKLAQENPLFFAFPLFFLVCGAVRLARFNVTAGTKAKDAFTGIPIPAAAGAVVSLLLFYTWMDDTGFSVPEDVLLRITSCCTVVVSFLMVSTLRYETFFGFFFTTWKKHFIRSLVLAGLVVVLALEPRLSFFGVAYFYVLYGIVENIKSRLRDGPDPEPIQLEEE
jgi:CDP-diacylglycerol--serine O-phosphatidyltransferase